jgi:predicted amidohydrolase
MRAIDCGKYQWTVRKFKLWHTDYEDGFTPSETEPFVEIRERKTGIYICYDSVVLFKEHRALIDKQIELLLIPSNWNFNHQLMERITDFALERIRCLKCCVFSNSNTVSYIKTRTQEKRITKTGFAELTI